MLISIIIPAYNVQDNIYNTLNSILNQTYKDFEIIIVNDGSTDKTVSVVEEILIKSEFNNYKIINKENRGVSSARNRGIKEASGHYLYFLDGDDYVSNDMVSTVKKYIGNGMPDVIAWGYNVVSEDKSLISDYFNLYSSELTRMTSVEVLKKIIIDKTLWICTCSAIYKKSFIMENSLLYTEGCSNGEDQEFTFKALLKSKEVVFINKVLSFYVNREGSISNTYDIKRFDAIAALQRTYKYMNINSNNELKEISTHFKDQQIVQNYLYNLHSCFRYSDKNDIGNLLEEIDNTYPKLNSEIKTIMRSYQAKSLKDILKVKIFLKSPQIYFGLIKLKYNFQKRKKKTED